MNVLGAQSGTERTEHVKVDTVLVPVKDLRK